MIIHSYNDTNSSVSVKTHKRGGNTMKIILDTDKKTITVPHNYTDKLNAINRMIAEYGGPDAPVKRPSAVTSTNAGATRWNTLIHS